MNEQIGQSHRQPGANSLGDRAHVERSDARRHVSILLVIFVILAVVGCSPANEEFANEPVLPTVESDEPGGFGALLSGELVVEDRCLYLVDDEFRVRWLPVFKADSVSWERDTLVYRGKRFEIGERVPVGGGEPASGLSNLRFLREPHDSCDVRNVWLASH